jgi:isoleucyl-tRNA synthetase
MQHVILLGRQKRNQDRVKTKYPTRLLRILHQDQALLNEIARLEPYILAELNVKAITYDTNEADYIELFARPNSPVLGKRLGNRFKQFKQLIDQLDSQSILKLQETRRLVLEGETFELDDILVFREARAGTNAVSNRYISIDLDTSLDPELIAEGLAREVVSRIQKSRKDEGLKVTDRINLQVWGAADILSAIASHRDHIERETLCQNLSVADAAIESGFDLPVDDLAFGLVLSKFED